VLRAKPISVFLTWSPKYLARNTQHKTPCYVVFSTALSPRLSHRYKYPPQHFILENPQPTFLPQCEWPTFTTI
jgi:hypothetical protein